MCSRYRRPKNRHRKGKASQRKSVCRSATRKEQNVADDFLQLESPYSLEHTKSRIQSRHERHRTRHQSGSMETGNRKGRSDGWRQIRTHSGSHSRNGIVLRHHRSAFFCPIRKQGRRLQRSHSQPIHSIFGQTGHQHGSSNATSVAKLCRPHHDRRIQKDAPTESRSHLGSTSQTSAASRSQFVLRVDECHRLRVCHHPSRRLRTGRKIRR